MNTAKLLSYLFTLILLVGFASCEPRDEVITTDGSANLEFSTDSILFDTVFNQIGTATRRFYVYNRGNKAINISQISLGRLASSPYKIIVDGVEADVVADKFLRGGDSLLVLVTFFADPNGGLQPIVDEDVVHFLTNGNMQQVHLQAFGQDVNFIRADSTGCMGGGTVVWNSPKPYLIFDFFLVEEGCVLQIEKGVRVFNFNGAILFVEGSLEVNGTAQEKVIFRGFRPEQKFEDVPGQWRGIAFAQQSTGNRISHAVIKNAQTGIQFGRPTLSTTGFFDLQVDHTLIRNMSGYGCLYLGTSVYMQNVVVTNCAIATVAAILGGNYLFNFCTFADYANVFSREEPHFILANNFIDGSGTVVRNMLTANVENTIIYGSLAEELLFDFDLADVVVFNNDILKTKRPATSFSGPVIMSDPKFNDPLDFDFSLDTLSPAKDAGLQIASPVPPATDDIEGNMRDAAPDIGAYERQE